MIAHSLPGEFFGRAQNLHGATFVIDAEFETEALDPHNVVIDIGLATEVLNGAAARINYRNLDEHEALGGAITTAEFLARYLHDEIRAELGSRFRGRLAVTLHESHLASARYRGALS